MKKVKLQGIYKIKNKMDEKVYIGQSKDIYDRWNGHEDELNMGIHGNYHLQYAWSKYDGGKNFEFSILELVKDEFDLTNCEEYLMDFVYKSRNSGFGYNIQHALKTRPMSEETRRNVILNHGQAKFKEKEVLDIVKRIKRGETPLEISKIYNVGKQVILRIKSGRNYSSITGGAIKDEDINQENLKKNINKNYNIKEFTEKDISVMVNLKKDGITYKDIGEFFGCSANKARKLILDNDKSIAVKKLDRKIDNGNRKLSQEDILEVLRLLDKGKNYGFIAEKFNVSNETIRRVKLKVGYDY